MAISKKAKKRTAAATAVTLAAAILLSGTFAWQSIHQAALNEAADVANPGGRLHDYFNGSNKDVFVENFTDPDDKGVPIFARVRLEEYMELGEGAGLKKDDEGYDAKQAKPLYDGSNIDDTNTWAVHHPKKHMDHDAGNVHAPFEDYWELEMGGKTVYMPTFNKDKNSLDADINGTYGALDETSGERYTDYVDYSDPANATKTDNALGTNKEPLGEETHNAAQTRNATVITMEQWTKGWTENVNGQETTYVPYALGDFWVYDEDGWAYWANPIEPGQTTGCLLNGIKPAREPGDAWYYAINVVGEFATAGDWGTAADKTGFYEKGITPEGLKLLNTVAGYKTEIRYIEINGGKDVYVNVGQPYELEADVVVKHPNGHPNELHATFAFNDDEATNAINGNTFTPTEYMEGQTYRLTATSYYDPSQTASINVTVLPADAVRTVTDTLTGDVYIDFGDNTFRELLPDNGGIGPWVSGGLDEMIGTYDDKTNVTVLNEDAGGFGKKFIGPDNNGIYWAVGNDGKLGTEDDVKVYGNPFPDGITDQLVDEVVITETSGALKDGENYKVFASAGGEFRFDAKVLFKGDDAPDQRVSWSVTGGRYGDTAINKDGVLTVDSREAVGTVLTVTATSRAVPAYSAQATVKVFQATYEDLKELPVGTQATVKIDDIEFYVLAKDGNNALIWSKANVISPRPSFGGTTSWIGSTLRDNMNNKWLDTTTILKNTAVDTTYQVRSSYNSTTFVADTTKVFLLSEADVYGTFNGSTARVLPGDYTFGGQRLVTDPVIIKGSAAGSFTRTLVGSGNVSCIGPSGAYTTWNAGSDARAAMWITMP